MSVSYSSEYTHSVISLKKEWQSDMTQIITESINNLQLLKYL